MRSALSALGSLVVVVYPAAVYYGLTRFGTRQVVWLLLVLVGLNALARLPRLEARRWLDVLKLPAAVLALLLSSLWFDDHRFLLATPVLINLVLLIGFAGSLRGPVPLVERFARLQVTDLSAQERRYCRHVTVVWSVFFVLNGVAAALLALFAPLVWWATYTGLVAYLLMGLLAASEYVVRKYRFGRYGGGMLDRTLQRVLPQPRHEHRVG